MELKIQPKEHFTINLKKSDNYFMITKNGRLDNQRVVASVHAIADWVSHGKEISIEPNTKLDLNDLFKEYTLKELKTIVFNNYSDSEVTIEYSLSEK
jgi:hypothetical protein